MKKVLTFALVLLISLSSVSFAQSSADYTQGLDSYRKGDWTSAMFFLRKASVSKNAPGDEVLYMLIMSEMYAGEYSSAKADCDSFFEKYSSSRYESYIRYQNGRALHFLNQNENSILVLSDFCHQNPGHDLYASALYWIAECFYAEYNFETARGLYERIVSDYPDDSKYSDAQYRIEMIEQRNREEKLLYLLKVTGEETLAAREDYERKIKLYQAEDKMGLRKQVVDGQRRIEELERQLEAEKIRNSELEENLSLAMKNVSAGTTAVVSEPEEVDIVIPEEKSTEVKVEIPVPVKPEPKKVLTDPEVEALKRKARALEYILIDTPEEK